MLRLMGIIVALLFALTIWRAQADDELVVPGELQLGLCSVLDPAYQQSCLQDGQKRPEPIGVKTHKKVKKPKKHKPRRSA